MITGGGLRDTSFESFLKYSIRFFANTIGFSTEKMPPLGNSSEIWLVIGKLFVLLFGGIILFKNRDKNRGKNRDSHLFFENPNQSKIKIGTKIGDCPYFGYVLILFVSIYLSPRVWPHIYIMTTPLILLSLAYLPSKKVVLWILVYSSFFLVPVFDVYPFSYHRLVCFIIFLSMLIEVPKDKEDSILNLIKNVFKTEQGDLSPD